MNTSIGAPTVSPLTIRSLSRGQAIFWGGLAAGVLDAVDGVIAYGTQGLHPIQVLQYIASGLLGKASFEGGLATAGLGTILHFLIAFVAAAVYVVAGRWISALKGRPVTFGLLYGAAVYFFMNYLLLPLSAVGHSPFKLGLFLNGVIGHALFVGVPIAWIGRRSL
jgi:uncharacterized membrane protein YagU involved in acid resistance